MFIEYTRLIYSSACSSAGIVCIYIYISKYCIYIHISAGIVFPEPELEEPQKAALSRSPSQNLVAVLRLSTQLLS